MMEIDRRTVLVGAGAIGLMALMGGCSRGGTATTPFFERIGKPIGLQLYALGEELTADIPGVLKSVAEMGYGEVELPSLLGMTAPEIRNATDAAGLKIACLHVPPAAFSPSQTLTFENDPDEIAAIALALGITQIVAPIPMVPAGFAFRDGEDFAATFTREFSAVGLDHWRANAARFNEIGAAMKERGLQFGYHNHNLEFAPVEGSTGWDVLVTETDPALVKFQLDIGWVATAGRDPVTELEALKGRLLSVHVKDVAAGNKQGYYFGTSPAEVGSGTLDWAKILPACEAGGVEHYFVEQEPPFTIPRVDAAAKSISFLKEVKA